MPVAMEHFDLYRCLPDDWLGIDERAIIQKLKKPTIFHCSGHDQSRCVVVSCLLRGNEPSGFVAIVEELKRNARGVARYRHDVIFLVGNVEAAKAAPSLFEQPFIEGQLDLKRCWKDGVDISDEWNSFIKDKYPIASLDFRNTSGTCHPFAVWTKDDEPTKRLANVLAGTHLFMPDSLGSFVSFNARYAPSIAVNCGKRGVGQSEEHARMTMQRFFLSTQIVRGNPERYFFRKVYTNLRPISVQDGVPFFFGASPVPGTLIIRKDIDRLNFMDALPGDVIGWAPKNYLVHKKGQLPTDDFFEVIDGQIKLKQKVVLAIANPNEKVAKADALFYIVDEMV